MSFFISLLLIFSLGVEAKKAPSPKKEEKKVTIQKDKKGNSITSWKILSEHDTEKNISGKNLKKVLNKSISIEGFMIPLDYNEKLIKEFLLVPYIPSCSHVPPPPITSIINVKMKGSSGAKSNRYPVRVIGKLTIPKRKKAPNPYMMEGVYLLEGTSLQELKD